MTSDYELRWLSGDAKKLRTGEPILIATSKLSNGHLMTSVRHPITGATVQAYIDPHDCPTEVKTVRDNDVLEDVQEIDWILGVDDTYMGHYNIDRQCLVPVKYLKNLGMGDFPLQMGDIQLSRQYDEMFFLVKREKYT